MEDRLSYTGDIAEVVARACMHFGLGDFKSQDLIEVGFEDYNVKILTEKGQYIAKVFSKKRTDKEISRNVEILQVVNQSDVRHPHLYDSDGSILYEDNESGLKMVVMDYVEGRTFYATRTSPNHEQLDAIAREVVKINDLAIQPEFLHDTWAIPNIHDLYEKTRSHIDVEVLSCVETVISRYDAIEISKLSMCFVHGDIIKSNVIMTEAGKPYIIDFSVANTYPLVQEVAVMAANLLAGASSSISDRVDRAVRAYLDAGGALSAYEQSIVGDYGMAGVAMEYMGSVYERVYNDESGDEVDYWQELARVTLMDNI